MQTWIIEFENPHFCGGGHTVTVEAADEDSAVEAADVFMSDYQYELFSDEYEEEGLDVDCEPLYTVVSVEVFDENHPHWRYRESIEQI